MNEKQEKLLALYREEWVKLNVVNALREELQERAREIHARQRGLANQIVAAEEERPVEPGNEPGNWKAV